MRWIDEEKKKMMRGAWECLHRDGPFGIGMVRDLGRGREGTERHHGQPFAMTGRGGEEQESAGAALGLALLVG